MITLFQFPAAFNVPNASPYCLKLETWLRLAGLEYQVKVVSDPRKAPKGKLPYVRIEGEAIGDSEIVIRTLGERYGVTLDAGLDARGKGWARAITRLCDEHLYYLMLYFRWFDEDSWRVLKPVFFGSLPFGVRDAVAWAMRRAKNTSQPESAWPRQARVGLQTPNFGRGCTPSRTPDTPVHYLPERRRSPGAPFKILSQSFPSSRRACTVSGRPHRLINPVASSWL